MSLVSISDDTFDAEVVKSDKLTIVDFWAEWCGPCKMIEPVLEALAKDYSDKLKITRMNVDENQQIPQSLGITSIPTLYFYKEGQPVDKSIGAVPKPFLKEKIDSLL